VVFEAVKQNWYALMYASDELKDDDELKKLRDRGQEKQEWCLYAKFGTVKKPAADAF